MEASMRLANKVALITGAAQGIGEGIARRFVREGAKVVVADLNLTEARETAAKLSQLGPGKAIAIAMNVTDEAQVDAGVAHAASHWGAIDVLVSNAGIQIVHAIEDFPYADWKKLLSVHLDGAFLTTKACLPQMYKSGSGSIIYMGSVHSKEASQLKSAYVTAKHGLLGLARVVAKEGAAHGVRANVICPGFVKTDLVEKQIPEQAKDLRISEEQVVNTIMLGGTVDHQFTTIEDVAEVALLFASFPTNALTGQSLVVSHGWFME
jgi:3-hydroxybutyrate dehydrogenase